MSRQYTVACLAGEGVGSELMAEATRALRAVSSLHGFRVEELHVPFGSESFSRSGHRLPAETRNACRFADAILVGVARDTALQGVAAELDLRARIARLRTGSSDVLVVSPFGAEPERWAVERAFELAAARRGHVTAVGVDSRWRRLVDQMAEHHHPTSVEHLAFADALVQLSPAATTADVVLAEGPLAEPLEGLVASGANGGRVSAGGRLAGEGPGLFFATHGAAHAIAGFGVANPSGMLLATALMLGEGLGERAAARTLVRAGSDALRIGVRTQDMISSGVASTTREFVDVVLDELLRARRDIEFFMEAPA
ncbi:MAG TPA: isocitrate/isopropylmalate family dehydrogenase [Gaiellaceae bacterium]